jgi:protein involved in polysaccharide export with SLBB domain
VSFGADPPTEPAPLQPGDAIEVRFSWEAEQTGTFLVNETGTAALPFLGSWAVTETPPAALRTRLLEAYREQLRNQTVEVRLLRRVRVLGSVQEPGLYHIDATMTLADIVATAGGATPDGKLEDTRILRGGRELRADVEGGAGVFQQLASGDQVFVPRKSWWTRNSALLVSASLSAAALLLGTFAF